MNTFMETERHPLLSIKPMKKIKEECPKLIEASMTASALALLLGDIRGGADAKEALRHSAAKALLKELTLQIDELVT